MSAEWCECAGARVRSFAWPSSGLKIVAEMGKSTTSFETVRKIGLELPGVDESTMYGAPALKVHGALLACVPSHRSAEPGSVVLRADFADRAALLAEAPGLYYITDHYVNYPAVLVRLSRATPEVLRDLLGMAYKFVTRKNSRSRTSKKPPNKPKPRSTSR
jgi:hypothetical protein